ncbi:MAG: ATP synthase F1 subunit delta [Acidobacteria bacterium]|nr:MAG: ATP synthase F1 subunit delta [Acidobacteriota bacterium]
MSVQARVAKRYSKAFVNAFSEAGTLERELEFLQSICKLKRASGDLDRYLMNVTVKAKQKAEVVKTLCKEMNASDMMTRFLVLLAEKGRLNCLDEIEAAVMDRVNEMQNVRNVSIVSSAPLTEVNRKQMVEALSSTLSSQVRLKEEVDPDIWGGAIVRVGSTVYDGSLKGKMKRLREELVKEK